MAARTLEGAIAEAARARLAAIGAHSWPDDRYQAQPVSFCKEVLGVNPWLRQIEVIEAVRDYDRVSVMSGHRVGKSALAALVAFWFYCSFPQARVIMTSTTERQVELVLWREIRRRYAEAKVPIDGSPSEHASKGLRSGLREILGFTARDAEGLQGIAGGRMLFIADEASGIPDSFFHALEGNRAGGAKLLLLGNPTRTTGEFAASHTSKKKFYKAIRISSEESPNVIEGREVIEGLATRQWCEEKAAEWGRDSVLYQVRVLGKLPRQGSRQVVALYAVDEAIERRKMLDAAAELGRPIHEPEGRPSFGLEVGRFPDDESAVAAVVGGQLLKLSALAGSAARPVADMATRLVDEIAAMLDLSGPVQMIVSSAGGYGSDVADRLSAGSTIEPVLVNDEVEEASRPDDFGSMRDEQWFTIADWLKASAAIVDDDRLSAELIAADFHLDKAGRRLVDSRAALRKKLHRTPSRAEALGLALCRDIEAGAEVDFGGDDAAPLFGASDMLDGAPNYWE